MKKFRIFGLALLAPLALTAQSTEDAKKAIDAEKFENAKTILKSIIKQSNSGEANFLLGNIYLSQSIADSAKFAFDKGISAKEGASLNTIGLAQLDLNNNNSEAAKTKLESVLATTKKKDFLEYIYVANAYMNQTKPDFKAAIAVLNRLNEKAAQEPLVLLAKGDAYYGDKNQNDSYKSYSAAFNADPSLIRAKMKLGVLLKGAKAYTEAVAAFNQVAATNPNYGPLYRELAETYYYWGANEPKNYDAHLKNALVNYEKYMSLTDYSLASRMRHADFLILAKDYKALEVEANKMKELDKVNPRIYRYLGYAAYENKNIDLALSSLKNFIETPGNKLIAQDYMYYGFSKVKKATSADGKTIDAAVFSGAADDFKKALELDKFVAPEISTYAKDLYTNKFYKEAASIFETTTSIKDSKSYLLDNFYLGNSIYFSNSATGAVKNVEELKKADVAFSNVLEAAPDTLDAYLFRARTNSLMDNDDAMVTFYQKYIDLASAKGVEYVADKGVKRKLVESYNGIAANFANTDKAKAIEFFNKTLSIDPANQYALDSVASLK